MPSIQEARPFIARYDEPNPFKTQADAAYRMYLDEIDSTQGWQPLAPEKDGIKLEQKGKIDGVLLPLTRGTCVIEGATPMSIFPSIQLAGMRKQWDNKRFADAWLLRRFGHFSYQWYNLGAPPPGLSWLISPRDCTGVGTIYVNGRSEGTFDERSEIVIVQTSVPDKERAPVVGNRTRMELILNAWRLTPQGDNNVRVTYLNKMDLKGKVPAPMLAGIAAELPALVGKLRDFYYEYGFAPHVKLFKEPATTTITTTAQHEVILHTDFFSLSKPAEKQWQTNITCCRDLRSFRMAYDSKRMYAQRGVEVILQGDAKEGFQVSDDGEGMITVKVGEEADGRDLTIVVQLKRG